MPGTDLNMFQVDRPWGNFKQFTHNLSSTVKILTVDSGEKLSLQSHKQRSEFWYVISGSGIMDIGGVKYNVKEGDKANIMVGVKHRLEDGQAGIKILEIATGDFDEEDEMKYEDKYGRV